MAVQALDESRVCLFCPAEVSSCLFQYLVAKSIPTTAPTRAMFGRFPQDELVVALSLEKASAEVTEFVASLPEECYERETAWPAREVATFVCDHTGSTASYQGTQLSWGDALANLTRWVPGFAAIKTPEQLGYDTVASIMAAASGGFQCIAENVSSDFETFIIEGVIARILPRTQEIIVVPDCGMVSLPPLQLAVDDLTRFVAEFEREEATLRLDCWMESQTSCSPSIPVTCF